MMLKLPLCPYCGARFLYPDVKKSKGKTGICPHCKKEFRITRGGRTALLIAAAVLVIIAINWIFLTLPTVNLPFLLIITAIGVTITWFLIPFTVQYKTR
jgi:CXXC-20-CXXC protein